jgi:hypothetical protein
MITRQTYAFCLHCVEGDAGICCLNAAKASMSQGAGNEDEFEAGSVFVGESAVAAYDVSVHDTVRNNSRVVLFQKQIEVQCGGHSADDPD